MIPKQGEHYQHYKGGIYVVDGVGKHSETTELMVAYRNINGDLWFRPLSMWNELVHADGVIVPRFEKYAMDGSSEDPNQVKLDDLVSIPGKKPEFSRCLECGRKLITTKWKRLGRGPVCFKKFEQRQIK